MISYSEGQRVGIFIRQTHLNASLVYLLQIVQLYQLMINSLPFSNVGSFHGRIFVGQVEHKVNNIQNQVSSTPLE